MTLLQGKWVKSGKKFDVQSNFVLFSQWCKKCNTVQNKVIVLHAFFRTIVHFDNARCNTDSKLAMQCNAVRKVQCRHLIAMLYIQSSPNNTVYLQCNKLQTVTQCFSLRIVAVGQKLGAGGATGLLTIQMLHSFTSLLSSSSSHSSSS